MVHLDGVVADTRGSYSFTPLRINPWYRSRRFARL